MRRKNEHACARASSSWSAELEIRSDVYFVIKAALKNTFIGNSNPGKPKAWPKCSGSYRFIVRLFLLHKNGTISRWDPVSRCTTARDKSEHGSNKVNWNNNNISEWIEVLARAYYVLLSFSPSVLYFFLWKSLLILACNTLRDKGRENEIES